MAVYPCAHLTCCRCHVCTYSVPPPPSADCQSYHSLSAGSEADDAGWAHDDDEPTRLDDHGHLDPRGRLDALSHGVSPIPSSSAPRHQQPVRPPPELDSRPVPMMTQRGSDDEELVEVGLSYA